MAKEYLIGDFLKRIKRPVVLEPNKEYNLVTIKMNHKGVVLRGKKRGCDIKSKMFQVKEGDFILSGIDARNGAFGIVGKELEDAIVTNDFWYFEIDETIISKELFLELTATTWFDDICQKGSDGTTQRIRLQKDKFFNQRINLPEGNSQKKLLTKILKFKNGYHKLNKEIEIQKNLIKQLKQAIFQEAIQGKLTEGWRKQNPNIEPANELLKRIKAEKEQLVKDKKIKKDKELPVITEVDIPFKLPENWVACHIRDLIQLINGKAFKPSDWSDNGLPIIRIQNLNKPNSKFNYCDFEVDNKYIIEKGDLLVAWSGTPGTSFGAFIWNEDKAVLNQHIFKCPIFGNMSAEFLKLLINSNLDIMISRAYGAAGLKHIKKGDFESIIIALPSLFEQNEIVKRVNILISKCNALELEVAQSEQHANMLMQAVLKEAFESKTEKTEEYANA